MSLLSEAGGLNVDQFDAAPYQTASNQHGKLG
jgi:hypothetical protein